MAMKKGGLGKGLGSLFEEVASTPTGTQEVTVLGLAEIEPDKDQPRKVFADDALAELASSIMEHGVLQPIVVRPKPTGGYKIIAGERRWRAARLAGLTQVPVCVKEISDAAAMEIALIENLQREDLDPVEEALGYEQLMQRCSYTQESAAAKLGKSRSAVANSLRLLRLPQSILRDLRDNAITVGHAKVLMSLSDEQAQLDATEIIIKEGLNVRQAELLCKRMSKAPKQKAAKFRPAFASEVELSLQESLGTQVHVQYKEGKGTLNVGFCSDEQLRAFANLLGKYAEDNQ